MAARIAIRLTFRSPLSKSFSSRGHRSIQSRLVSTTNNRPEFFGTSRRFMAVLATGCGATLAGFLSYRMISNNVKARPVKDSNFPAKKGISDISITLYQYQNCPFCGKVRAFLNYYGIKYNTVEVSPLWKSELSFSKYKKVPLLMADDTQVRGPDSSNLSGVTPR